MYSIDINLLRERTGEGVNQSGFTSTTVSGMAPRSNHKLPMLIGMGVGAVALIATGGLWWFTSEQTAQLETKQKDLDAKLGSLKTKESRLKELTDRYAEASAQTQSLASVFNQIQPWSAILQDLRENIPQGVKIDSIAQIEDKPAAAAPAAAAPAPSGGLINKISTPPNPEAKPTPAGSPAPAGATAAAPPAPAAAPATAVAATLPAEVPTTKLTIAGTAKTFDEVNNFVLTLKQSAFFNPDDTRLVTASLAPTTLDLPMPKATTPTTATPVAEAPKVEMPKVVVYSIQTSIKRVPANALMQELERKGAVGLVARLRLLQQQQVIKP